MLAIEKLKSDPASLGQTALTGVFIAIALMIAMQTLLKWDEAREISEHRAGIQQETDEFVQRIAEGRHLR